MRLDRAAVETMLGIIGDRAKNRGYLVPFYIRELLANDAEQRARVVEMEAEIKRLRGGD